MTALEAVRAAQARGVALRTEDGRLLVRGAAALSESERAALAQHRAAILEYLDTGHTGALVPAYQRGRRWNDWFWATQREALAAARKAPEDPAA